MKRLQAISKAGPETDMAKRSKLIVGPTESDLDLLLGVQSDSDGLAQQIEGDLDEVDESIREYDITAIPNDFNVKTIFDFIQSGSVRVPGFQRHYVWDLKRASKLIESVIIGLPIPQIFLYEDQKNTFLVIDGQQRLMSLYFFIKGRFPRMEHRAHIRSLALDTGIVPNEVLEDDKLFRPFQLQLPSREPNEVNPLHGLRYSTLGPNKTQFDLRTIRNVIIRQNSPAGDDSSIYEIFNRLNSGGVNLKPQEIRVALYHSPFYIMLARLNADPRWRAILGIKTPDLHLKDMEILLRSFAMLVRGDDYKPSLVKFINRFSREAKSFESEQVELLKAIGERFLEHASVGPKRAFYNRKTNRFNVPMFEAVFAAACRSAWQKRNPGLVTCDSEWIDALRSDPQFAEATQLHTTGTPKVKARLTLARTLMRRTQ